MPTALTRLGQGRVFGLWDHVGPFAGRLGLAAEDLLLELADASPSSSELFFECGDALQGLVEAEGGGLLELALEVIDSLGGAAVHALVEGGKAAGFGKR